MDDTASAPFEVPDLEIDKENARTLGELARASGASSAGNPPGRRWHGAAAGTPADWLDEKRSLQKTIRAQAVRMAEIMRMNDHVLHKLAAREQSASVAGAGEHFASEMGVMRPALCQAQAGLNSTGAQVLSARRELQGELRARAPEHAARRTERVEMEAAAADAHEAHFEAETVALRALAAALEAEVDAARIRHAALEVELGDAQTYGTEAAAELCALRERAAKLEAALAAAISLSAKFEADADEQSARADALAQRLADTAVPHDRTGARARAARGCAPRASAPFTSARATRARAECDRAGGRGFAVVGGLSALAALCALVRMRQLAQQ